MPLSVKEEQAGICQDTASPLRVTSQSVPEQPYLKATS